MVTVSDVPGGDESWTTEVEIHGVQEKREMLVVSYISYLYRIYTSMRPSSLRLYKNLSLPHDGSASSYASLLLSTKKDDSGIEKDPSSTYWHFFSKRRQGPNSSFSDSEQEYPILLQNQNTKSPPWRRFSLTNTREDPPSTEIVNSTSWNPFLPFEEVKSYCASLGEKTEGTLSESAEPNQNEMSSSWNFFSRKNRLQNAVSSTEYPEVEVKKSSTLSKWSFFSPKKDDVPETGSGDADTQSWVQSEKTTPASASDSDKDASWKEVDASTASPWKWFSSNVKTDYCGKKNSNSQNEPSTVEKDSLPFWGLFSSPDKNATPTEESVSNQEDSAQHFPWKLFFPKETTSDEKSTSIDDDPASTSSMTYLLSLMPRFRSVDNRHSSSSTDPQIVTFFNSLSENIWDVSLGSFQFSHHWNPYKIEFLQRCLFEAHQIEDENKQKNQSFDDTIFQNQICLDVGCGGGILAEALARRGAYVLGIDAASELIKVAQKRLQEGPYSKELRGKIEYKHIALENLTRKDIPRNFPKKDKSGLADVVICSDVIEHLRGGVEELKKFFEAAFAMLKPGGILYISSFNRTAENYLSTILLGENVCGFFPKGFHNWDSFFTPAEVEKVGTEIGFSLQSSQGYFYLPYATMFVSDPLCRYSYMQGYVKPIQQ